MSERPVVGLLHPGEMGSAVGATLVASGARVLWASAGRGAQSRERAQVQTAVRRVSRVWATAAGP